MRDEIPDTGDGGVKAANHRASYVPMQQSCIICTRTPEPKLQLKKKNTGLGFKLKILKRFH